MDPDVQALNAQFEERFKQLPKVVQDAITSADLEQHLRDLANTHKLHLDQWDTLENEVKLALYGFEPVEDLASNIEKEVGVEHATALALAEDISHIVFEPIRAELERRLEHPDAQEEKQTAVESARSEILQKNITPVASAAPAVAPATPPKPAPTEKAARGSLSDTYVSTASHERKAIEGDPYREQVN